MNDLSGFETTDFWQRIRFAPKTALTIALGVLAIAGTCFKLWRDPPVIVGHLVVGSIFCGVLTMFAFSPILSRRARSFICTSENAFFRVRFLLFAMGVLSIIMTWGWLMLAATEAEGRLCCILDTAATVLLPVGGILVLASIVGLIKSTSTARNGSV